MANIIPGLETAKIKEPKTKEPSGLTITRNVNKLTLTWKIADANYGDGQTVQYRLNDGKWVTVSGIGKKTTTATIDLTSALAKYKPTTTTALKSVTFRVRGQREQYEKEKNGKVTVYIPKMSEWAKKTFDVKDPVKATVSAGSVTANATTFTAACAVDDTSTAMNTDIQWHSILLHNSNIGAGKDVPWANASSSGTFAKTGGSRQITESGMIATDSYTRWFRVISRGPQGKAAASYAKHVYAMPLPAKIKSTKVTKPTGSSNYVLNVQWSTSPSNARPIDSVRVEYIIGNPGAGMTPPSGSWTIGRENLVDAGANSGTSFTLDSYPGINECGWVRVITIHDDHEVASEVKRFVTSSLSTPTGLTATINGTTATVTVTNTAASDVPDSRTLISLMAPVWGSLEMPMAVIANGATSTTFNIPANLTGSTITFRARAFVGDTSTVTFDGMTAYVVTNEVTKSITVSRYGTVPAAPENVRLTATAIEETIRVAWSKTWSAANRAELSWSDHEDAWESTDEPETYIIEKASATAWNISGCEAGKTWYVRVRLIRETEDETLYSPYSDMVSIELAVAPVVPVLELSKSIMTAKDTVEATWAYVTGDGTGQASADVAEIITSGNTTTYKMLAHTTTAQHATIDAKKAGWTAGTTHRLVVRVMSKSGQMCDDWSAPVPVIVANALNVAISQASLQTVTEDGVSLYELRTMPFTITVTGAGTGGTTSVSIVRAMEYHIIRPDESIFNGYEDETIAIKTQTGQAQMTFNLADLIGNLDDGAWYTVIATISDNYGQTAETSRTFRVNWSEQAIVPECEVSVDDDEEISIITPIAPTGASQTATCDIYRLSVDKPVLIYKDAVFGTSYVDPYPTIGEQGGHRLVYRTQYGDYITDDNMLAWLDVGEDEGDILDVDYNLIDWETGQVRLEYNIDLSHSWSKDFTETKYLGGAVQGDWNPAVSRTGSVNATVVASDDPETIQAMRRLATHAGICHIRTKDGSSYAADVQVSEDQSQDTAHKLVKFGLSITRVDGERLDGMTLDEWIATHPIDPDKYVTDTAPYLIRPTGGN